MSNTVPLDTGNDVPEVVQKDELPARLHFDIAALYEVENARIHRFLKDRANASVSVEQPSIEVSRSARDKAILELEKFYDSPEQRKDRRLYGAALQNRLEEKAPSRAAVTAYLIVMLLALSLEVGIGLLIYIFAQGSVQPVVLAALLAGAGYMAGDGLAGLLNRTIRFPDWGIVPEHGVPIMDVVKLVGGTLLIVGLSYGRAAAAEDAEGMFMIVLISAGLALVVAVFKALYGYTKEKYRKIRDKMADAQTWFAREKHGQSLDSYRDIFMAEAQEVLLAADPHQVRPGLAKVVGGRA